MLVGNGSGMVAAAVVFLFWPASLVFAGDRCSSPNDFDLGFFDKPPSIGIRLFDVKFQPAFSHRDMEGLRQHLAEQLRQELMNARYFAEVRIVPDDAPDTADLALFGEFIEVALGTHSLGWTNLLTRGANNEPSFVGLSVTITRRMDESQATTFNCRAGFFAGSPVGKARSAVSGIARDLRKVYSAKAKRRDEAPRTNKAEK